jgi:UDP-glucose 4-epimerase
MSERVLVTGGAGFIGSHVADSYLEHGYDVTVLDDLSTGRRENVPAEAEFVQCGVNDDRAQQLLADGGFTVLNHHAAQMDVRVSVTDPMRDERINISGLLNLLEGVRAGGVRRVLFASSGGVVYGDTGQLPHREEAPKLPVSPYGVSKLASEYYLAAYALLYGVEVVSLRYANVYGPRQNPHGEAGVVAIFAQRIRNGEAITVYGDGAQTRDYVFVGDVVRANLEATRGSVPPVTSIDSVAFNVGTGVETSVNQLAAAMLQATRSEVPIRHADARPGELLRSAIDAAKLNSHWGWRPAVTMLDGLKRTYQWVMEST